MFQSVFQPYDTDKCNIFGEKKKDKYNGNRQVVVHARFTFFKQISRQVCLYSLEAFKSECQFYQRHNSNLLLPAGKLTVWRSTYNAEENKSCCRSPERQNVIQDFTLVDCCLVVCQSFYTGSSKKSKEKAFPNSVELYNA